MATVHAYSDSGQSRAVPFLPFAGAPPPDTDALMAHDSAVFEQHPDWRVFYRPLCAADEPQGTFKHGEREMTTVETAAFRAGGWRELGNCNAVRVVCLGPGLRAREFYALAPGFDLRRNGKVSET
jgi:hypothetical protein